MSTRRSDNSASKVDAEITHRREEAPRHVEDIRRGIMNSLREHEHEVTELTIVVSQAKIYNGLGTCYAVWHVGKQHDTGDNG